MPYITLCAGTLLAGKGLIQRLCAHGRISRSPNLVQRGMYTEPTRVWNAGPHRGLGQLVQRRIQFLQRIAQVLQHHVKVLHREALLADEVRVRVRQARRQVLLAAAKHQRQERHLRVARAELSARTRPQQDRRKQHHREDRV